MDASSLLAGLIFGGFGLIFLRFGKKDGNFLLLVLGLVLMVYPYFVTNPWATWLLGTGLSIFGFRQIRI
jgi:ABC-type transport system involved in multi-copper enzyme maturation permease subunit